MTSEHPSAVGGVAGRPPEAIPLSRHGYSLRRVRVDDAPAVAALVRAEREHLRPHMPWASDEASGDADFQRSRISALQEAWDKGEDFGYALVDGSGAPVGSMSFFARRGPGALEIGYWLARSATGRGVATAGARALTDTILAIEGIHTAIICCDAANRRSALIPARLGYELVRVTPDDPFLTAPAPGDCGRTLFWHCTAERWHRPPDIDHVETEALLHALARAREGVVCAVAGAPDPALGAPGVPSGTNLLGIVAHLMGVEEHWFDKVLAGLDVSPDFSMSVATGTEPTDLLNAYLTRGRAHDALVREWGDPSRIAAGSRTGATVRRVLTHLIAETARHAGHADILREQADAAPHA